MLRVSVYVLLSLLSLGVIGCRSGFKSPPRVRMGSYASSTLGTRYSNPDKLGKHSYNGNLSEKSGIIYTCKTGHIDLAHLRKSADWTAYLSKKIFKVLMKGQGGFSYKMKEPSRYYVKFTYPSIWKALPQTEKEKIAHDVSIKVGQYITYTATTWHEIITWFGYKCTGMYSEYPSAFTWEDTFSNLIGSHLAVIALRDEGYSYDEAMTLILDAELEKLNVQSSRVARRAADIVRGEWYSGDFLFFITMKKRNFDIGLDDGFVTPSLVPGLAECEGAEPQSYPIPTLDFLSEYRFSMLFEIEPREWEKNKVFKIVYPNKKEKKKRIDPIVHFPILMDYIKKAAIEKYGPDVDLNDSN